MLDRGAVLWELIVLTVPGDCPATLREGECSAVYLQTSGAWSYQFVNTPPSKASTFISTLN